MRVACVALSAAAFGAAAIVVSSGGIVSAQEDLPNLKVKSVSLTFIPYEPETQSPTVACKGPFIDLKFVVTNSGADFPAASDLALNRQVRTQEPEATMIYFTLIADLTAAGPGTDGQYVIDVDRSEVGSGVLKDGASIEQTLRVRVLDNQTSVRVSTSVVGGYFLKVANGKARSEPYDSGLLEIPLWDIYTEANLAIAGTIEDETVKDKKTKVRPAVLTRTDITNRGKTATPGPIRGSFEIRYADGTPGVSWSGKTNNPIAPSGVESVVEKTPVDTPLKPGYDVKTQILLLCPNGKDGDLSDGNRQNNMRTLGDQVVKPPPGGTP
jgi:hypothetical protein